MPTGTATTDAEIAEIRRLAASGLQTGAIARRVHLSPSVVRRYASPEYQSGRERVLRTIVEHGPLDSVDAIRVHVPDVDQHTVIHLLYALRRSGLVRFRVARNGTAQHPVAIEATAAAKAESRRSAPAPVVVEPPPEPAAADGYPLVHALSERSSRLAIAAQLLEAAGADDLALAAMAKVDDFTPVERETIRLYAAARAAGIVETTA